MLKTALRNVSYKLFWNFEPEKNSLGGKLVFVLIAILLLFFKPGLNLKVVFNSYQFILEMKREKVNLDGLASDLYPALPNRPDKWVTFKKSKIQTSDFEP